MQKKTEYEIIFYYPGILVSESSVRKVESPDPKLVKRWPKNAYAFNIYEKRYIEDDDGTLYVGPEQQIGPRWYHPSCVVETLEEVKRNHPEEIILISNMEINKYKRIIRTKFGSSFEFDPKHDAIWK